MIYTPGIAQTSGGAGGQTLYTNVDALGSVHDTQTNGNATQDALRTDAFGGTVARQGSDTLSLGFAASSSYQTDSDTGLMLLGNRYYDLSTGRFISPDPSGDGDNWYAYCGNDPLGGTDPTGLQAYDMDGNPVNATQGANGAWRYPQGDYWSDSSGYFSVNAEGDIETGTTPLTRAGYNPGDGDTGFGLGPIDTAFNQLNQSFENSRFGRALSTLNDALNYLGSGPHQESGITVFPPGPPNRYSGLSNGEINRNFIDNKAMSNLWGTGVKDAQTRLANPATASELKAMNVTQDMLQAYQVIGNRQVGNPLTNSSGIHNLRLQIIEDALEVIKSVPK